MRIFPVSWRRRPLAARFARLMTALVVACVLLAPAVSAGPPGAGGPSSAGIDPNGPAPAAPAPPAGPAAAPDLGGIPLYEIDLTEPGAWDRCTSTNLDYLRVRRGWRAVVLGWPGTRELLDEAGLCYTELTPDYGGDRARQAGVRPHAHRENAPDAVVLPPPAQVTDVPLFGQGSIAGHWSYDEVCALLDSLASHDTAGILTEVDTLGLSLQGRPILALGVAAETAPLGTRPEVLFTALTHAREPEGMQAILYTLLQLVDGYGVDPEVTYLVDEREIWFVPVVNPDGYVLNEGIFDDTGGYGYWRKNLRDNDGDTLITTQDGVDLNRNFGYEWGYDDAGSSPNPSNVTYRGPSAFSESETQAVRDFCLAHAFRTANNYHTYHEACLYPWGYISADPPDSTFFIRAGDAMTEASRYTYGRSGQVLYPVNGDANDWMYGEDTAKPRAFAFTTEVGNQDDGFWAPPDRILPLARINHPANLILAYAAGVYLTADSLRVLNGPGVLRPGEMSHFDFRVRHLGATGTTSGGVTVIATSGNGAVTAEDGVARFPDLTPGDAARPASGNDLLLRAELSAVPGTLVPLYLTIEDGAGYVGSDTLLFRVGEPVVVFADSASNGLANWSTTGLPEWSTELVDGDPAFSDSPAGAYPSHADMGLWLNPSIDLSGASAAVLRFRTRWDIEVGYDFAWVDVRRDTDTEWTQVSGLHTRPGHGTTGAYAGGTQAAGSPGYDGAQRFWTVEEIDLTPWAGEPDLRLRFRLRSDVAVEGDGWLIDDITVLGYAPASPLAVGDPDRPGPVPRMLAAAPNPFRASTEVLFDLPQASPFQVGVYDVAGRRVRLLSQGISEAGPKRLVWDGRLADGRLAAAGNYFLRLETPGAVASAKVLLLR